MMSMVGPLFRRAKICVLDILSKHSKKMLRGNDLAFKIKNMFTGIIEATGLIRQVMAHGANLTFEVSSPLSSGFKPDQSVAHDGVCLTVEAVSDQTHRVTAIRETLEKTVLGDWTTGRKVNLERAMVMGARLDGHLVQGHVDARGRCLSVEDADGSWRYRFSFPDSFAPLMIEKGSICVNGISLTAFDVTDNAFSVAIIPYTYEQTNISGLRPGDAVNLEFDMIGKYVARFNSLRSGSTPG
jgi:riboflavin synthase